MRRQRTSSEASEEERIEDTERAESVGSIESTGSAGSTDNIGSEDEEMSEDEGFDEDEEMDTSDDEDEYDEEDEDEGEYFSDEEMSTAHLDLMNQLQSALLGFNGTALGHEQLQQLERLRMSFPASTGATHSSRIRSIIGGLPAGDQLMDTDPMILYSAFTELWELIVLTGEEVEAYEFDSVVDLKPLLGHLLRVLAWDAGCQVYGGEFLLYAIRCTRACVQYSPGSTRRLVETGLVPLITHQLFSVEYIDLAEDSVQIIHLLAKNAAHSKACLQCDGIKAVLGFVDFLGLSAQVNAFTAAAHMAACLTDETLELHLPADLLGLLRSTIRRAETENDAQVTRLIHQAARMLLAALAAAPKYAESIFPADFVLETVLPHLTLILPSDSAAILLRLLRLPNTRILESLTPVLIRKFLRTLLSGAAGDEAVVEDALRIVVEIYCRKVEKPLLQLIPLCTKRREHAAGTGCEATAELQMGLPRDILFDFYLRASSVSLPLRHFTLVTLLLLDGTAGSQETSVSLEKMAVLSKLLTELKDPLSLVIGLEWFRILSHRPASSAGEFLQTATRQGLPAELEALKMFKSGAGSESASAELKKWLEGRLESLNRTVFSGDEDDVLSIYVRHLATSSLLSTFPNSAADPGHHQFSTIEEFLGLLDRGVTFTEYEWLGDPETCLARRLLSLLGGDDRSTPGIGCERFRPVCEAVYRALNRYDTLFTSSSVKTALSDPFASLSLLNRPMRVILRFPATATEKMFICDPMTQVGWLVRVATCAREEERKIIMRYSGMDGEHLEVTRDASSETTEDVSHTAFASKSQSVTLTLPSPAPPVPLRPNQSVLAALFASKLKGTAGDAALKRINELWSSSVVITVADSRPSPPDMDASSSTDDFAECPTRVRIALELLQRIPLKIANEPLTSKLSKELNSVLLTAVGGISGHWIKAARQFPFLFDFGSRVNLMRTACLGSVRALGSLHSRLAISTGQNGSLSAPSLPRRKFRVDRANFLKCLRHVFAPVNNGDFRSFEFEYLDELGTGHGPTLEFYALAAKEICRPSLGLMHVTRPGNLEADEIVEAEGEGLFPAWSSSNDHMEEFRILGALVARAWFDDRIIDIPLHPIFLSKAPVQFKDLSFIDKELFSVLSDPAKMIGTGIAFQVPGTEIQLIPGVDRMIDSSEDLEEFQGLLMKRINEKLACARGSFLQGFNSTFPESFDFVSSFFPPADLVRLISPSRHSTPADWSVSAIKSALVPDHGFRSDSPQITWLAELLSEAPGHQERMKLIQFMTGAAYLPVGGWKSLHPPLTIVCKTFSDHPGTNESTCSIVSTPENHDVYLPSVMTCANYLKLPRYSSKSVMKERLDYAVREGCGSFYLS